MAENKFLGMRFEFWKWLLTLVVVAIFSIGIHYARLQAMEIEQKAQACEMKNQNARITNTEKDVICLKTELPNLKDNIQEIKKGQDEIQKDIKLLLRKAQ